MKLSKKILCLLMVFVLFTTSTFPGYTYEIENEGNTGTAEAVYLSVEKVIDWFGDIYLKYQEQIKVEETEVKIERRQVKNEVREIKLALDPVNSVPLYNQLDYPNVQYGCCGSVASHGCGVTSLAMVASYLLDEELLPDKMAIQFADYNTEKGSYWVLFEDSAEELGLNLQGRTDDTKKVMEALANGQVVISLQGAGLFTSGGHFIVLVGLTEDGKIIVNDPNGANYNKNSTLIDGFKNGFAEQQVFENGGPYWIYGKKDASTIEKTITLNLN